MDRVTAIERMVEFVDGEIKDVDDRMAVQKLIDSDPEVEQAFRRAKKYTTTMLETLELLRAEDGFEGRVMSRVHEEGTGPDAGRGPVLWPYALLAGLLTLLVLLLLLRSETPFAEIAEVEGDVVIARKEGEAIRLLDAKPGLALISGDKLRLSTEGRVRAVLLQHVLEATAPAGPAEIHLYPEKAGARVFLTGGTLRVQVGADAASGIILQAQRVAVEPAPGTRLSFTIVPGTPGVAPGAKSEGGSFQVIVEIEKGRAVVSNATDRRELRAGDRVLAAESGVIHALK
jgi:hypothetical protein